MSFLEIVLVGFGGFLGAAVRYLISIYLNRFESLPIGTLLLNVGGSFLIGFIFGLHLDRMWMFFLVSGLLGALTTFSTLYKECFELWMAGKKKVAVIYIGFTFVGSLLAALFGYYL